VCPNQKGTGRKVLNVPREVAAVKSERFCNPRNPRLETPEIVPCGWIRRLAQPCGAGCEACSSTMRRAASKVSIRGLDGRRGHAEMIGKASPLLAKCAGLAQDEPAPGTSVIFRCRT